VPVSNALERADAITVQSIEMKFLLCKFGRHLRPKIHFCSFFQPIRAPYQQMAALWSAGLEWPHDGQKATRLPEDRTLVGIGHNGGPEDNIWIF